MSNKILQTFFALLWKDITIFNKRWVYRSIDAIVWMSCILFIAQYIMPLFGVHDKNYATFTLIGNLAVWGLFEMLTSIAMFLGDIQGDKTISYYISLPLPTWLIFTEQALASAYRSIASTILLLPLGALMLGKDFITDDFYWVQFCFAFIMINIFYGFFTLFIASCVPDTGALTMVRSRIMFPLWFLGGFQFPWKMLYSVNPTLAYCNLCNPIVYIMDGLRSSALPAHDYLPFWHCMIMLVLFSTVFGYLGIRQLKKRLDCM